MLGYYLFEMQCDIAPLDTCAQRTHELSLRVHRMTQVINIDKVLHQCSLMRIYNV